VQQGPLSNKEASELHINQACLSGFSLPTRHEAAKNLSDNLTTESTENAGKPEKIFAPSVFSVVIG
jgi:hypothetical protein